MTARTLRIGTRGSTLARIQARWVADRLAELDVHSELVVIRTEGDDRSPDTVWGEGAFVARIVEALITGEVDVAVHSAKDVPTDEHPELVIAAYPKREDARDALVCRVRGTTLDALPSGARVGTDSPRRVAFLRSKRPDLAFHPLHGNVDTRLAKLDRGETDALVLAVAGLTRLGRSDRIDEILSVDVVAPAPGQGSLAVQVRASDEEAREFVAPLDHPATRCAVVAERSLLNATGGGCRSPIGALGIVDGSALGLIAGAERTFTSGPGATISLEPMIWVRGSGDSATPRALAERLASSVVAARARPRVLVARAASQALALVDALEAVGVGAVSVPGIAIAEVDDGGSLDRAIFGARQGTWLVVTSGNAAMAVLSVLGRTHVDPDTFRWAAVGVATAQALRSHGIADPFVPTTSTGQALAAELPLGVGDLVLLPRTDAADDALPAALRDRGAHVEALLAYRTVEAPAGSRELLAQAFDDGPIDALVLTSGSSARGLLALADDESRARLRHTPVVTIGQPTAVVAREAGYDTVLVSPTPSVSALAAFTATSLGITAVYARPGGLT